MESKLCEIDLKLKFVTREYLAEIDEAFVADNLICVMGEAIKDWCVSLSNRLAGHLKVDEYTRKVRRHRIYVEEVVADWEASLYQP